MLVALIAAALTAATAAPSASVEMVVAGPTGALKGTFAGPASGAPVAMIIPGSGPTDRDGNNPLGIKAQPYRLLADALAAHGVATVRVDKRGMFGSAGAGDPDMVTMDAYAANMAAWTRAVKARTGAPCVWLIGHSEGALTALITAQTDHDVCGLVLISGAGRKLGDVLRQQLSNIPGLAAHRLMQEVAINDVGVLEAGGTVDPAGLPPALAALFAPKVQPFLRDLLGRDPAGLVRGYPGPVLVLQGTTDLQTTMTDAERLAGARPGVKLVRLEGMNHVLKIAPVDRAGNVATYADPGLPLAPGVADAVAGFIKAGR